jgi:hypothetical protein
VARADEPMIFTAPRSIRSAMTKIHRKMPGQSGAISGISGANPGNEGLDNSLKHKDKESGRSGKLTNVAFPSWQEIDDGSARQTGFDDLDRDKCARTETSGPRHI